jgi:hypothetical protein
MIHERDIPSVQYEMNIRWSESMREVDGRKFIFNDFNAPALAPCIDRTETAA